MKVHLFISYYSGSNNMSSLSWMRCCMYLAILCSSFEYQENKTTTDLKKTTTKTSYKCACKDKDNEVYDLSKLQRSDGSPRFLKALDRLFQCEKCFREHCVVFDINCTPCLHLFTTKKGNYWGTQVIELW